MACDCQSASEPVDLATLNAILGRIDTTLTAILALMEGKIEMPVVATGADAHTQFNDVWTLVEKDTNVQVEARPESNSSGSLKVLSIDIYVGPAASSSGAVLAANTKTPVPDAAVGTNYQAVARAGVPAGYYFKAVITCPTIGADPDGTRIILTPSKT